jgi:hypothetical protein
LGETKQGVWGKLASLGVSLPRQGGHDALPFRTDD